MESIPQPQPRRRTGRKSTAEGEAVQFTQEESTTAAPKKRQSRRNQSGPLDADDIIGLITFLHNAPSQAFKLEELHMDDDAVKPYAADIAKCINQRLPTAAKAIKEGMPFLGVAAFLVIVEAPTLINTYKEIIEKQAKRKKAKDDTIDARDGVFDARQATDDGKPISMLDRLGVNNASN